MNLFLDSNLEYAKTATAEVTLPEDPAQWPQEILQELYKQVPYIADFMPDIVMDRVDAEQRFGFGHVEVSNKTEIQSPQGSPMMQAAGVRSARIPIIVKEGKLQPFDVIVTEKSKMLPLTERRLRQTLFRPQLFDVTSRTPGDQSMISQLYPPYRQNYGFGGGGAVMTAGMGKEGADPTSTGMAGHMMASYVTGMKDPKRLNNVGSSLMRAGANNPTMGKKFVDLGNAAMQKATKLGGADDIGASVPLETSKAQPGNVMKAASILEAILPTINASDYEGFVREVQEPRVKAAYYVNKVATDQSIRTLAKFEPKSLAERGMKLAQAMRPSVMQIVRVEDGYVVKTASHRMWAPLEYKLDRGQLFDMIGDAVLTIDKHGAATMVDEGAEIQSDEPEADQPEQVKDFGIYRVQEASGKQIVGFCFPNLLDLDGSSLPMILFTNGSQTAVQGDIAGIHVASGASLMEGPPRGHGVFYQTLPNGAVQATIPLTITNGISTPEEAGNLIAETMDGRRVTLSVQPGVAKITMADEQNVVIPDTFRWMPLEETETVELAEQPEQFEKAAAAKSVASVFIRAGGESSFSLGGGPIDKLAYDDRAFLDVDQAMFLLGGLGVTPQYAMQKLGEAIHLRQPIEVPCSRLIAPERDVRDELLQKAAEAISKMPQLRQNLIKEAAAIPDPTAVDSVLSLGFINPENMMTFVGYLPQLDETQNKLCELLIAARLGMRELPSEALERAIRGLEGAIEGLNVIAFNKPN